MLKLASRALQEKIALGQLIVQQNNNKNDWPRRSKKTLGGGGDGGGKQGPMPSGALLQHARVRRKKGRVG